MGRVEVSNPDKVIFPQVGLTKQGLVDHYSRVAEVMVPHLAGRPLTLARYPNGVDAPGFMQKNASKHFPAMIRRVTVPKTGGTVTHPVVDDGDGLVYLANQGTVTFHIWGSRETALDHPDRMVMDLDPPPGSVEPAKQATRAVREILEGFGAVCGVMTTGSKGYHVVVTLDGEADYEVVGRASRGLAELVVRSDPDSFTTAFKIADRRGRVFIDWLRNQRGQTGVCPWSLRPTPQANVATPIGWDELDMTDPGGWTALNIADRLSGKDPLSDLPVTGSNNLCRAIAAAVVTAGIDVDATFDRFRS